MTLDYNAISVCLNKLVVQYLLPDGMKKFALAMRQ